MENGFSLDWTEFEWESIHRLSGHPRLLFDSTLPSAADTYTEIGLQECPEGEQSSIPYYTDIDRFLNEEPDSTSCQDMLQLDDIDWEWDGFDDAVMQEVQTARDDLQKELQANVSNLPAESITPDRHSNTATVHSDSQMYSSICTEDLYRHEDQKGLRVAHLLLACAEAVAGDAVDLVDVILDRLRGLVCASGSSIERVGYYLYHVLQSYAGGHMELPDLTLCGDNNKYDAVLLGAFQVLVEVYPYIRFAHFTANQIILEAVTKNTKKIHIVDFDIMEGLQWPPFMEALSQRSGHPLQLRITALKRADVDCGSISSMTDTSRRLSDLAISLCGLSLVFEEVQLEDLDAYAQEEEEEEQLLIMNCMWELAHMTCPRRISELSRFLQCAGRLRPAILTLANGAFQISESRSPDLANRLWESLHHFSAVFDSLEGRLPEQGLATALVERIFLCPKIKSSVAIRAPDHDNDTCTTVAQVIAERGFVKRGALTQGGLEHARALLYAYNAGSAHGLYRVDLVSDELVLKWGLTALVYTSAWELTL